MIPFTGTSRLDGWSAAIKWALSVRADVSVLWFNEAGGRIERLCMYWDQFGYHTDRSWGGYL